MQKGIHPNYRPVVFQDAAAGFRLPHAVVRRDRRDDQVGPTATSTRCTSWKFPAPATRSSRVK